MNRILAPQRGFTVALGNALCSASTTAALTPEKSRRLVSTQQRTISDTVLPDTLPASTAGAGFAATPWTPATTSTHWARSSSKVAPLLDVTSTSTRSTGLAV